MKVVGSSHASAKFLPQNAGIDFKLKVAGVPGQLANKILFDPDDLNKLRPKYVYIVAHGDCESYNIEVIRYRLGQSKRVAHQLIGTLHGEYRWSNPNNDHGEVCRWENMGGDFVSIRKVKVA